MALFPLTPVAPLPFVLIFIVKYLSVYNQVSYSVFVYGFGYLWQTIRFYSEKIVWFQLFDISVLFYDY